MNLPELLAPAGNFTALKAAVFSGADAVYMGGKQFGARAFADNFSGEEMAEAVEFAHLRGVKIYITVNTLLANEELTDCLAYVEELYQFGVDGIIVQDLGLLWLLRADFPHLPVLASTQMTIANPPGLALLSRMGVQRVILPRETGLDDLAAFTAAAGNAGMELFIHGALCVCYSGQCLMSSLIGGRSGNRGRCAQPCRMEYTLCNQAKKPLSASEDGLYLLSPRDLCSYELLPELLAAPVRSLKLEGRMKRAEYVSVVTDIYRRALDNIAQGQEYRNAEDEKNLKQIFNRGFTTGYLKNDPGLDLMSQKRPNNRGIMIGRVEKVLPEKNRLAIKLNESLALGDGVTVWVTKGGRDGFIVKEISQNGQPLPQAFAGQTVMINMDGSAHVGDRVFKTHDAALMQEAKERAQQIRDRMIDIYVEAKTGRPLLIRGQVAGEREQTVVCDYIVEKARTSPTNYEGVKEKIGRLGGSGFALGNLEVNMDEDIILPASVLNEARRQLLENTKKEVLSRYQYPPLPNKKRSHRFPAAKKQENRLSLAIQTANFKTARMLMETADILYVDGEDFAGEKPWTQKEIAALAGEFSGQLIGALPRVWQAKEEAKLREKLALWHDIPLAGVLCGNLGSVELARELDWQGRIYGDFGLNVFNGATIAFLAELGLKRAALSLELTLEQIRGIGGMIEKECLVHGAAPLMVSRHCVAGSVLGGKTTEKPCAHPCLKEKFFLKDRKEIDFPLLLDKECRMHIFNSKEHRLLGDLDQLKKAGVAAVRLDLRLHGEREALAIAKIYREAVHAVNRGIEADISAMLHELQQLSPSGFTKGHYYRGVMEGEDR